MDGSSHLLYGEYHLIFSIFSLDTSGWICWRGVKSGCLRQAGIWSNFASSNIPPGCIEPNSYCWHRSLHKLCLCFPQVHLLQVQQNMGAFDSNEFELAITMFFSTGKGLWLKEHTTKSNWIKTDTQVASCQVLDSSKVDVISRSNLRFWKYGLYHDYP